MAEEIVLTPAGKIKIELELEQLRSVEMPALAERIRDARDLGDLSENFDYQDSKRQQGFIAGRIADLQAMLERARIVEESGPGSDTVGMGSTVRIRDTEFDDEFTYKLVGSYEADPSKDLISISSPLGTALVGRVAGEEISVEAPAGTQSYKILEVL